MSNSVIERFLATATGQKIAAEQVQVDADQRRLALAELARLEGETARVFPGLRQAEAEARAAVESAQRALEAAQERLRGAAHQTLVASLDSRVLIDRQRAILLGLTPQPIRGYLVELAELEKTTLAEAGADDFDPLANPLRYGERGEAWEAHRLVEEPRRARLVELRRQRPAVEELAYADIDAAELNRKLAELRQTLED